MASSSSSLPIPTPLSLQHEPELPAELIPAQNYKNLLIQFTQRANMTMPEYSIHNEGESHVPKFRCSLVTDGLVFTVPNTFFHRRAAEQEVSRVALEFLVKKIKDEGRDIISKSVTFCKGLLNEYAVKLNLKPPTYKTANYSKVYPCFVCTMDFNCTSYVGDPARRKKDAEDLAARAAILSIIDNSDSGIMLVQMVKAKAQLFNAVLPKTLQPTCDTLIVSPIETTALSCELIQGLDDKDKGDAVPAVNDNINNIETVRTESAPVISKIETVRTESGPVVSNIESVRTESGPVVSNIESVRTESGPVISTPQQPEMPNPEPAPEAAKSPNGPPQPDNALPIDNVVSAKKRRRNNHKANKRARKEALAKALSSVQVPSPSMSQ